MFEAMDGSQEKSLTHLDADFMTGGAVQSPPWERAARPSGRFARSRNDQWPRGEVPHEGPENPNAERRDAKFRRSLALCDVVAAAVALFVGVSVLGDETLQPAALLMLPLIVIVGKTVGLYDRDEHLVHKTTLDQAPEIFQLSTLAAVALWLGEGLLLDGRMAQWEFVGVWLLLFCLMLGGRAFVRRLVTNHTPPERILVIGDAMRAERLRAKVASSYSVKAEVVGRVTPTASPRRERLGGPPVLGGLDDLAAVLLEHDVHRAVIAPGPDSGEILHTIRLAKLLGVKVSVLPRLYDVVESSVELDDIDGLTMLGIRRYGLTMSSLRLKRAMDVLAAGLGLILLAPLFALTAIAIKATSRGPVFFRQRRIGQWAAPFEIFKFRTMYQGSDELKAELEAFNEAAENGFFKIKNDPRVTPVGRVLRRTCIDELPQLFNVLRGEMSLVGPRPLINEEDSQIQGWDRRRLFVRPGMTGLWQVFGSARVPMNEMVKIDYLYGANWSVWTDVKILLRTFSFVVSRRGV